MLEETQQRADERIEKLIKYQVVFSFNLLREMTCLAPIGLASIIHQRCKVVLLSIAWEGSTIPYVEVDCEGDSSNFT